MLETSAPFLLDTVSQLYKIATLLYCFDESDRVLLLRRNFEPNLGLWSPCGGKLKTDMGESPYDCAVRELKEETGMEADTEDLHLTGVVSEQGVEGQPHWLMFLFEVKKRFREVPPVHPEGEFAFFTRAQMEELLMPQTDWDYIWPLFWKYRSGFFSARCRMLGSGKFEWKVEEDWLPAGE